MSKDILERFGPVIHKTLTKDEFFMTLMKLRLDLSAIWNISGGLCTQLFYEWVRGDTRYVNSISKQTKNVWVEFLKTLLGGNW